MRKSSLSSAIVVLLSLVSALPVSAQPARLGHVAIGVSSHEIGVPGKLGVTVRLQDGDGWPLNHRDLPSFWVAKVTLDRRPVQVELAPSAEGGALEGQFAIKRSGVYQVGARVVVAGTDVVLGESEAVRVVAVAPLDFGVIRAGETVCRPFPDGGWGILGRVVSGSLAPGLRLWNGCLVADSDATRHSGTFRAAVDLGEPGSADPSLLYDVTYRLEPQTITPRRILLAFLAVAGLVVFLTAASAVRRRRPKFDPGTVLVWTRVEASPYRGPQAREWESVEVTARAGRSGAVDVGLLLGAAGLGRGVLRVRPTDTGLVEFIGPPDEELHTTTRDSTTAVATHRLAVPYGATVSFRDLALALQLGEPRL